MKVSCVQSSPPIGALFISSHIKSSYSKEVTYDYGAKEDRVILSDGFKCVYRNANELARLLAKFGHEDDLLGRNALEKSEVDSWICFAAIPLLAETGEGFLKAVSLLSRHTTRGTFLAGGRATVADYMVFAALIANPAFKPSDNVLTWFNCVRNLPAVTKATTSSPNVFRDSILAVRSTTAAGAERKSSEKTVETIPLVAGKTIGDRAQEGKFVDLPGVEMGKVVVRFPPEASGYLHIGHAKAALLNQYYQQTFEGRLIMRFDDTNPAKEDVHFERVILEDVAMLQIEPDLFTHTSQYFDEMLAFCEQLLHSGDAYVDDIGPEQMRAEREGRIESANRSNECEKNLKMWREMKAGSDYGQKCCVRAKIDMQSPNGCMRDPTIYRCKNEPHPRTGTKYKVYPTYDFACPIVDAIEDVTHTLRTMEYHDRDAQFYWFIEKLGLRRPYIWEYSRLSMTNTVLSKRKLTWFVHEGHVDGWDDARMPTVRGVLRRGMTVEGLKQFIIAQGSSRSVVFMEWDKIWAFNKKIIDPIAPRFTALDFNNTVQVNVKGVEIEKLSVAKHPKNTEVGTKDVWISDKILIDQTDALQLKENDNTTFINWGNLLIKKINKEGDVIKSIDAEPNLENKDYKKTLKLTWLAKVDEAKFTPTYCVYFDHLISKALLGKDEDFKEYIAKDTRKEVQMFGDPELKSLKQGDIIQLQRIGFFRVDVAYKEANPFTCREQPIVLFYIPDGHTRDSPNVNVGNIAGKVEEKQISADNSSTRSAATINTELNKQADLVRDLKSKKAPKVDIDAAVKCLLTLKAEYKTITGTDWKQGTVPAVESKNQSARSSLAINNELNSQADLVRDLKNKKAPKVDIDAAVKLLLDLKAEFKTTIGTDWKQGAIALEQNMAATNINGSSSRTSSIVNTELNTQADLVRDMKTKKALKVDIDAAVKQLLALKAEYKALTGTEWKQGAIPTSATIMSAHTPAAASTPADEHGLTVKVNTQAKVVRTLKSKNASKEEIDFALKELLHLKTEYKKLTGNDFPSIARGNQSKHGKSKEAKKDQVKCANKEKSPPVKDANEEDPAQKKQTRLCIEARKEQSLSSWYSEVITKGEMIEYYDVSGCYILRPWSFSIWEAIREWFDAEIKKLGVQNCYFPIFVSKAVLEKEKTHIADFAPEVAWVTKSGNSDMAEPIAVRPTSETVMYPAYAKWIQSHRDLPIKLNQWNNVVRWEFSNPQPFLRTREFLWQEGHTAHATATDAQEEVRTILELYARIYTDLLAVPVIRGRKTEKEKFAGGDYTTTVEAFVSASGRAVQGATSHFLGQNFSRMFDITYEVPGRNEKRYVEQNSWGISTRTIGVMIMVHGDNTGLVLPPRVARIQCVIVPCGITAKSTDAVRNDLQDNCTRVEEELRTAAVRVHGDYRDNQTPGWKYSHWELKGVPLRIEYGPKDIEKKQLVAVRRDTGEKIVLQRANAAKDIVDLLDNIQTNLYNKALKDMDTHKVIAKSWDVFCSSLEQKNIILAPFCGEIACEEKIKAESARTDVENVDPGAPSMGGKSLCIPFQQPAAIVAADVCIHPACTKKPQFYTLFGRSY